MTLEEAQAKILELQDQVTDVTKERDSLKELTEGFKSKEENYKSEASKLQEKVTKLRDFNTDLFLKVSQTAGAEQQKQVEENEEEKITLSDLLED